MKTLAVAHLSPSLELLYTLKWSIEARHCANTFHVHKHWVLRLPVDVFGTTALQTHASKETLEPGGVKVALRSSDVSPWTVSLRQHGSSGAAVGGVRLTANGASRQRDIALFVTHLARLVRVARWLLSVAYVSLWHAAAPGLRCAVLWLDHWAKSSESRDDAHAVTFGAAGGSLGACKFLFQLLFSQLMDVVSCP